MSKSILKQSSKIGILALLSRCIAFAREILLIRFLSVGHASDVFYTAFRTPNTLRKIFAEGALASILIPAFVNAQHNDKEDGVSKLTTLAFLSIEAGIALLCLSCCIFSTQLIGFLAPGFDQASIDQAGSLLKILMSFLWFVSSGAIFAAALQSQKMFFIPAIAPAVLNVTYVGSLAFCLYMNYSITTFCWYMIGTAILYFALHVVAYIHAGFNFQRADATSVKELAIVGLQFVPCIISVGITEINHIVNTRFGSYLATGSLTLLRSTFQFVNIPVGIIAASLVTVLLPHFSKIHLEKPEELSEHIEQAIKFIIWSTLPICFLLTLFSRHIFETLFFADAQAMAKIPLAQSIFIGYLIGLLAYSLNKVFLSIFYALRMTMIPMLTSCVSIVVNYVLCQAFIHSYQAAGIAFASACASIVQMLLFIIILHHHLHLHWKAQSWLPFLYRYGAQLTLLSAGLWATYQGAMNYLHTSSWSSVIAGYTINASMFTHGFGVWFWAGPCVLIYLGLLYITRKKFGIQLQYFEN